MTFAMPHGLSADVDTTWFAIRFLKYFLATFFCNHIQVLPQSALNELEFRSSLDTR